VTLQCAQYFLENDIGSPEHFIVPEAQDTKTPTFKPACPGFIRECQFNVLAAIDLNHQLLLEAHEVDDVGADGLLPLEFPPLTPPRA